MKTETKQYGIRRGQTEIDVPHKDGILTYAYDKHGPGTYAEVADSIDKAGLCQPTMAETASLVHTAFHADEPEFDAIRQLMKGNWLWAFTGSLYTSRGTYVQDNPVIRDGIPYMEESELVKKLEAGDKSVRFVRYGYPTGEMSSIELAKNAYVKALAGEEGAEKLAEIADKRKQRPYLWSLKSVRKPETRVSALDSDKSFDWHGLYVYGDYRGSYGDGHAFGVNKKNG